MIVALAIMCLFLLSVGNAKPVDAGSLKEKLTKGIIKLHRDCSAASHLASL